MLRVDTRAARARALRPARPARARAARARSRASRGACCAAPARSGRAEHLAQHVVRGPLPRELGVRDGRRGCSSVSFSACMCRKPSSNSAAREARSARARSSSRVFSACMCTKPSSRSSLCASPSSIARRFRERRTFSRAAGTVSARLTQILAALELLGWICVRVRRTTMLLSRRSAAALVLGIALGAVSTASALSRPLRPLRAWLTAAAGRSSRRRSAGSRRRSARRCRPPQARDRRRGARDRRERRAARARARVAARGQHQRARHGVRGLALLDLGAVRVVRARALRDAPLAAALCLGMFSDAASGRARASSPRRARARPPPPSRVHARRAHAPPRARPVGHTVVIKSASQRVLRKPVTEARIVARSVLPGAAELDAFVAEVAQAGKATLVAPRADPKRAGARRGRLRGERGVAARSSRAASRLEACDAQVP